METHTNLYRVALVSPFRTLRALYPLKIDGHGVIVYERTLGVGKECFADFTPLVPFALPLPLAEAVADVETVRASVYNADEALVTQLDEEAATGV